ncbi:MAG: helix-turn-helix domain-containing protein [Synergistaceae bacterium]|jgi:predicted DNA-binding protein YlxM (UPF0122 family)|nr:helix-turn-helix domain-containing protein [Synergistaceae bacterium]
MARKTPQIAGMRQWVIENILTSGEAAEYLCVSRQAIHNAIKRGSLVPVKDGVFLKSDLDEYDKNAEKMRPKHQG